MRNWIQKIAEIGDIPAGDSLLQFRDNLLGGPSRNRTGVQGFAVLCVTTPPSGPCQHKLDTATLYVVEARV